MHLILILALPIISSQNPLPPDDKLVEKDFAEVLLKAEETAHHALQLVFDVFGQLRKYECAINAENCYAWQAVALGDRFLISNVDCDEEPEDEICKNALQFLKLDQGSSHEDILNELFNAHEGIARKDYEYINKIRDAVTEYTCYRQKSTCEIFRY